MIMRKVEVMRNFPFFLYPPTPSHLYPPSLHSSIFTLRQRDKRHPTPSTVLLSSFDFSSHLLHSLTTQTPYPTMQSNFSLPPGLRPSAPPSGSSPNGNPGPSSSGGNPAEAEEQAKAQEQARQQEEEMRRGMMGQILEPEARERCTSAYPGHLPSFHLHQYMYIHIHTQTGHTTDPNMMAY